MITEAKVKKQDFSVEEIVEKIQLDTQTNKEQIKRIANYGWIQVFRSISVEEANEIEE